MWREKLQKDFTTFPFGCLGPIRGRRKVRHELVGDCRSCLRWRFDSGTRAAVQRMRREFAARIRGGTSGGHRLRGVPRLQASGGLPEAELGATLGSRIWKE